MIYYLFLRTSMIPYQKVPYVFRSLEEINIYLDNVKDFDKYIIAGYEKGEPTYYDYGYIDNPKALVKTPHKNNEMR